MLCLNGPPGSEGAAGGSEADAERPVGCVAADMNVEFAPFPLSVRHHPRENSACRYFVFRSRSDLTI